MPAKLILWFLFLPPLQTADAPAHETVTIKAVAHLPAKKAVELLRNLYPIASVKEGVATPRLLAEAVGDQVVMVGSPEILRQAADLLSELDKPVREPAPKPQPEPTSRYRARIAAIRWNGPPPSDQGPWAWFEKLARDHADRVLCDISLPIAADSRASWGGGKTRLELNLRRSETADLRLGSGELSFDGAIPLGQTTILGDAASGWIVTEIQPIK